MTKLFHSFLAALQRNTFLWAMAAALVVAMLLSLCIGAYQISFSHVAHIAAASLLPGELTSHAGWTEKEHVVVTLVRMPRILLATLAGIGLGLSGAALQGMMRNPLVGPDLIGITSGASFGGVAAILAGAAPAVMVGSAFGGGLLALALASGLARLSKGGGVLPLILAGVIVSAFFGSLVGLAKYVADPETKLPGIVYWLMGSFAGADGPKVWTLALPTLLGGAVLMGLRWRLNLLSLGDLDAVSLGAPVQSLRWVLIGVISLIIAAQVSVSGGVGWVGLVVPHFARMLVGPDHRRLLPAAALLGGLYLLLMDDLARCLTRQELPIGLLTSLVGTPVFAVLFWKTQTKGWAHD